MFMLVAPFLERREPPADHHKHLALGALPRDSPVADEPIRRVAVAFVQDEALAPLAGDQLVVHRLTLVPDVLHLALDDVGFGVVVTRPMIVRPVALLDDPPSLVGGHIGRTVEQTLLVAGPLVVLLVGPRKPKLVPLVDHHVPAATALERDLGLAKPITGGGTSVASDCMRQLLARFENSEGGHHFRFRDLLLLLVLQLLHVVLCRVVVRVAI
uniref:(northern house mosquito) hypothetical protein n=1 Tax=Culex pipiens TaxID=7175 RepID=A0A8D7ZW24_CULPI